MEDSSRHQAPAGAVRTSHRPTHPVPQRLAPYPYALHPRLATFLKHRPDCLMLTPGQKSKRVPQGSSKPKRVRDPRAPASLPGPLIGDLQLLLRSLFHACRRSWPSLHTCRTLLQARLTGKQPPSKLQPSPSHGVHGLLSWAVPPQPAALRRRSLHAIAAPAPCWTSRPPGITQP